MKITKENINQLNIDNIIKTSDINLLNALLTDINEINKISGNNLYIDIQDFHNEYSAERTEPCPDNFGYYSIRSEKIPCEKIGDFYNIQDLDNAILIIYDYITILK